MKVVELQRSKVIGVPDYKFNEVKTDPKTGIPYKVFPWIKDGSLSLHAEGEQAKRITLRNSIEFVFEPDTELYV